VPTPPVSTGKVKPIRSAFGSGDIGGLGPTRPHFRQSGRFEGLGDRSKTFDRTLYGYYLSADYQIARRWFAGARLDRADRAFEDSRAVDRAVSATLTFWPSEFSQIRGQLRRTSIDNGPSFNEFLVQLQFAIGAHGAHAF